MNRLLPLVAALALASCASHPSPEIKNATSSDGVLVSHLTRVQVREIAAARARENGFNVNASDPWTLSLTSDNLVWTVMLQKPGEPPARFWLLVNDETGKADFMMPMVNTVVQIPDKPGAEWLFKAYDGIRQTKFPVRVDDLLRRLEMPNGDSALSGGRAMDGRLYYEYTLRQEPDSPARFELRCYYTEPEGMTGPKIATSAELYYIDAKLYYYRLQRDNQ